MKESMDSTNGRKTPFLHCFFEMGDGGSLAFFQFLPDAYGPANKLPPDAIDHHIAMSVPDFEDLAELKAKLDKHGYQNCGINHGFCYSPMCATPMGCRRVRRRRETVEITGGCRIGASRALQVEQQGPLAQQSGARNRRYRLATSPAEIISKVTRGH
jgi:hypothetical protein